MDDDISLILSAHNIISSFGTFINALLFLSSNIKNLYKVSYGNDDYIIYKSIHVYNIDLTEYHKLMTPWRNTEERKKLMIDYQNIIIKNN